MDLQYVNDHEREDVLEARIAELERALVYVRSVASLIEKAAQMALAGSATYDSELSNK